MSTNNSVKELVQGHLVLQSLMSSSYAYLNSPFMQEVDVDGLGLIDYYDIVKEPMWMERMDEKFRDGIYESIGDFVCDFRLMLLNCYRYNGVDSKMGKIAVKLETLFEQKLQILPYDIRQKTTVQATLDNSTVEDDIGDSGLSRRRQAGRVLNNDGRHSTPMLAVAEELETHSTGLNGSEIEAKTLDIINRLRNWERKRHDQKLLDTWDDWWRERVSEEEETVLRMNPELPDIFQFLCVARQTLNLDDLISGGTGLWFAELEAALVAPRGSQLLAAVVTSLLSNGRERAALSKKPLPSYARWNHSLQKRLNYWYQVLHDRAKGDATVVLRKIGVEEIFFKVFGYKSNLMRRKHFHELSIYQRIIALKSLIDYAVWTQDTVRACIDDIDWNLLRPIVLGCHGGYTYIRFPTFDPSGALRIYRQRVIAWPDDTPEEMMSSSQTFGYIPAGEHYTDRGDNITNFCFIVPPAGGKPNRKPVWMKSKAKYSRSGRDMAYLINTISSSRSTSERKTRRSKRKSMPRNGSSRTNLSILSDNLTSSPYASRTPSEVGTYDEGEETDSLMETDDNTIDCTLASGIFDNNIPTDDQSLLSVGDIKPEETNCKDECDPDDIKEEIIAEIADCSINPQVSECLNGVLDKICIAQNELSPLEDVSKQEPTAETFSEVEIEEDEVPEISKPSDDFNLVVQELPQLSALLNELQCELDMLEEAFEKQSRPNRRRAAKKVSATPSDFDNGLQELRDLVSILIALKSQMEDREPIRSDEMKLIKLRIRKQDESYETSKIKQKDDKILQNTGDESPPEDDDDDDDPEENSRAARLARRLQRIEEEKCSAFKPAANDIENEASNNSIAEDTSTPIGSISNSTSSQRRSGRARRPNMAYYNDSDMDSGPESVSVDSDDHSARHRDDEEDYRPPGYYERRKMSAVSKRSRPSMLDEQGKMPRMSLDRRDSSLQSQSSTKFVNGNCYMAIPRLPPKPQPTIIARSLAPFVNTNTAIQYSNQTPQTGQIIVQPTIRVSNPTFPQNFRVATVIGQQVPTSQNRSDIPVALVRPLLQQPTSSAVNSSNVSRSNQAPEVVNQSTPHQILHSVTQQSATSQILRSTTQQSATNQILHSTTQQPTTNQILHSTTQQPTTNQILHSTTQQPTTNQILHSTTQQPTTNQILHSTMQQPTTNQILHSTTQQSATNQILHSTTQQPTTNQILQSTSQSVSATPLSVRTTVTSNNNSSRPATVTITNHVSPNSFPVTAQSSSKTSPAKKVFRVFEHFFTEDLQPVSLNGEAGTMTYLPKESVPFQRYELARRMIAMYKSKQQQQGHQSNSTLS